ncbi:MAG TPA: SRPBCC domain-containing protein [Actinomycetota bacterium]|jgi:uncharacterized protein YndB with AHSA1/START domain|nr:SRPBCC domain-containing protein [Actinomycetota bacterium]
MKDRPAVEREIVLPASPERVWSSLTEGRELSAWFGAQVEFEARPGAPATFRWPDGRSREATIEEIEPPRRLSFRWAPFERTGNDARVVSATRVELTLEPSREGTLLRISERTLEGSAMAVPSYPVSVPASWARPSFPMGSSALRVPIR